MNPHVTLDGRSGDKRTVFCPPLSRLGCGIRLLCLGMTVVNAAIVFIVSCTGLVIMDAKAVAVIVCVSSLVTLPGRDNS